MHPKRVLELTLAHPGSSLDVPVSGLLIQLLPGVSVELAGTGDRRAMSSRRLLTRILSAHGPGALPLPRSADMGLALALLLRCTALGFLAFGPLQVAAVTAPAFVF